MIPKNPGQPDERCLYPPEEMAFGTYHIIEDRHHALYYVAWMRHPSTGEPVWTDQHTVWTPRSLAIGGYQYFSQVFANVLIEGYNMPVIGLLSEKKHGG